MNSQIESWRVQAFGSNVLHLSQQKESRFAGVVRNEMFKGKVEFFDRLALAAAVIKTGRNDDTPNLDITHSRRAVTARRYHWGTLVDQQDKLQNIHSPESEYAKAASYALGRSADQVILAALLSSAASGEDGTSTTSMGNTNKVAAVDGGAISKLNVQALRKAKKLLDAAEADGPRYFAINSSSLEALLGQTEVTSSDFNSVKALVNGELDTFLGFKFIRTELLGLSSINSTGWKYNADSGEFDSGGTAIGSTEISNIAFCGDALILGMREGMIARISERDDKAYSAQVYASRDLGAVRMEENKVVEVIALP